LDSSIPLGDEASGDSRGAEGPAITASSSKLTLTFFFFLGGGFKPSSDMVSDASLGAPRPPPGMKFAIGELVLIDEDGECFIADLAGDTDRGGG
jgi:hypothetical protein